MTDTIGCLIAEARKLGLTDGDWRCIKDAHGILSEKEIIHALEKFIEKEKRRIIRWLLSYPFQEAKTLPQCY
jgi:hypothetical protein